MALVLPGIVSRQLPYSLPTRLAAFATEHDAQSKSSFQLNRWPLPVDRTSVASRQQKVSAVVAQCGMTSSRNRRSVRSRRNRRNRRSPRSSCAGAIVFAPRRRSDQRTESSIIEVSPTGTSDGFESCLEESEFAVCVQDCIRESRSVKPWCPKKYTHIDHLRLATRNKGSVEKMRRTSDDVYVAVKCMPNDWIRSGFSEFGHSHPEETEQPWVDIGVLTYLNKKECPYVCTLDGIFCSSSETFIVSSLATEGDLLDWMSQEDVPCPGRDREVLMRPLAKQICAAVRWLHELDICHGDLSLENICLTHEGQKPLQVKLIDFGMATIGQRRCQAPRGKGPYQAPEMHTGYEYDPVLNDVFAVGVVIFGMVLKDLPWESTVCLEGRKFDGQHYIEVLSEPLISLLDGLLRIEPEQRLTLYKQCRNEVNASAWDLEWL